MTATTSKLGADMLTDEEIFAIADDNDSGRAMSGRRLFSERNLLLFARALLARQPVAIGKGAVRDCAVCGGTGDVSGEYPGEACQTCGGSGKAQEHAAPSVEQDERGAFIEAYMEARAASVAQAGAVFDNDWPAKQMWSAGIAYARAASNSANVAQGAEAALSDAISAVEKAGYKVVPVTDWTALAKIGVRQNSASAMSDNAAPPAQTALTDDARDAKRYRWLRENRPVLLITGFFGNGCVNRRIEEVDHEIDAALTAAQSASGETK
jgi:hypothetical protein